MIIKIKNKKLYFLILLVFLSAIFMFIYYINRQNKTLKNMEEFILYYYSFIENRDFDTARKIAWSNEENKWFLEILEQTWESFDITDKKVISLKKIDKDLYESVVELDVYVQHIDSNQILYTHPYVGTVNNELRIFINKRDIPEKYNVPFDRDEGILDE